MAAKLRPSLIHGSCAAELRLNGNSFLQVTLALLNQKEFAVVSKINNALVTAGYTKESADVAGAGPSDQPYTGLLPSNTSDT